MARAGLGPNWTCLFANDVDEKKGDAYRANWGKTELLVRDIGKVVSSEIPPCGDLAWASFPCQDLSLAGMGAGLKGEKSGTFWPFWKLIQALKHEQRAPRIVVLENVCGALTSHAGKDFRSLLAALRLEGYRAGAVVIDAALFVPQSRPRLFIIGVSDDVRISTSLVGDSPEEPFHTPAIVHAFGTLSTDDQANWVWWRLPVPTPRRISLPDVIEDEVPWDSRAQTQVLLDLMSPLNLRKVRLAKKLGRRIVGTVYKRTRVDSEGSKAQRAEVRFDDIAGCLRTPGGGSSRQTILVVDGSDVRSRLLSVREAARLMGLDDGYELPQNYNDGYHLMGDGVAVPVVRHISRYLLEHLALEGIREGKFAA